MTIKLIEDTYIETAYLDLCGNVARGNLTEELYRKKVFYGWYGKFIGGNIGAPYEGVKNPVDHVYIDKSAINNLPNDDADYEIAWFELFKQKGLDISSYDLSVFAREHIWYPFGEYGYSMRNSRMGIYPPFSGSFNNDYWGEGMGCPIRSEIWAYLFPANPEKAAEFAIMDAQIDHKYLSIWCEVFLSAMQSACFVASDLNEAIEAGLRCIPTDSRVYLLIRDTKNWASSSADTYAVRNMILQKYGHPDFTHCLQNIGFTILALLRGEMNFWQTMEIAVNCGYDTDCTCATAGATLGILKCDESIDKEAIEVLGDEFIVGIDVPLESKSIKRLAAEVCDYGIKAGALDADKNNENYPTLRCRSGAVVNYRDTPVISPESWTEFEMVNGDFPVNTDPSIDFKKSRDCYAVKLNESVRKPKDFYTLTVLDGLDGKRVGFATAKKWYYFGPYFSDGERSECVYPPHGKGNENLPSLTEMFNSSVCLDKEYLNEKELLREITAHDKSMLQTAKHFFAGGDMIDIDGQCSLIGPCCVYLASYFELAEDEKLWIVVGNNTPFKCWLDGEELFEDRNCKFWMPYNNEKLIELRAGIHSVAFKALRVDSNVKLSMAFKEFKDCHHHRSNFKLGLSYVYKP